MAPRICCPTCAMSASLTDHRHFRPDGEERRICRNCGAEVSLLDLACLEASGPSERMPLDA